jgi:Putative beta-barrel porin-2, OmpL-like. bbp2
VRARIVAVIWALAQPARIWAEPATSDDSKPTFTVGGYLEEYYQVSFQNPSNRITNLRGYDNRSRTFTLSNVAIDVKAETGPFTAHVILQIGHTPSTYYLNEPTSIGTSSVDTSTSELWKYIQTATFEAKSPEQLVFTAGLLLSPIGLEAIPVKGNWNWSRSNLAFELPDYVTGATIAHPLGCGWTAKIGVFNGWNSVVDNNGYPSVMALAAYTRGQTTAQLLYFGGIERPSGVPEGSPWRNLVDAIGQTGLTDDLAVAAQFDAGVESGNLGTSWWVAVAGYAKLQITSRVYGAVRGDYFYSKPGEENGIAASPIFFPVRWLAEGTGTVAYQPLDRLSLRLEYRHDQAASDAYFGGTVATDPITHAFVPNRESQDTLTLGVTGWL